MMNTVNKMPHHGGSKKICVKHEYNKVNGWKTKLKFICQ